MSDPASDSFRHVRAGCPNGCAAGDRTVEGAAAADRPWRVVACLACNLLRTDPRPPPDDDDRYYPDDYGPHREPRPRRLGKRLELAFEAALMRRAQRGPAALLAQLWGDPTILPPPAPGARMIDIGCGTSDYPARLRAAGWSVLGLEPDPQAAERARRTWGIEVTVEPFPCRRPIGDRFDLATMLQVLEHFDDPLTALRAARDLLRPGGRVLATVPNAASWSARRFGSDWIGWDLPRHRTHFTPNTLRRLATAAGLEPQTIRTLPMAGWMRESAARSQDPARRRYRAHWLSDSAARFSAWLGRGDNLLLIARRAD